jgi:hypothetical protein
MVSAIKRLKQKWSRQLIFNDSKIKSNSRHKMSKNLLLRRIERLMMIAGYKSGRKSKIGETSRVRLLIRNKRRKGIRS